MRRPPRRQQVEVPEVSIADKIEEMSKKFKDIDFPAPDSHWHWGVGRRKTSIARVRVKPGSGKFTVNKREVKEYFSSDFDREAVVAPLRATHTAKKVDVHVNVRGGGSTGQAGAIVLGLSRALKLANNDFLPVLKVGGYLTRDARMVERKKYGRRGARRRFQFSKR